MREALVAFRRCEVDDAATGEQAFELALKRPYAVFLLALTLPDMAGDMLDRLLAQAYPRVHSSTHSAPPVVFLLRTEQLPQWTHLSRGARVRGHVVLPPRLDLLLSATAGILPSQTP
jgi:CheY-like chemotaxis protein